MEDKRTSSLQQQEQETTDIQTALIPSSVAEAREEILTLQTALLGEIAQEADFYARQNVFADHQRSMAWNTVRKEIACLTKFMTFLTKAMDMSGKQGWLDEEKSLIYRIHLAEEPRLWAAISFGLVKAFKEWELLEGCSIKTVNDHLSILKRYARLAQQTGYVSVGQLYAIEHVPRIKGKEAERIDAGRTQSRIGQKKAEPTFLSRQEFAALLGRPDTPQGWRDRVAILLMYDLSLRPGEVVSLRIKHVSMEEGTILITRHKTGGQEQHARLKDRLFLAMQQYLRHRKDLDPEAPLLVQTRKNGELVELLPRQDATQKGSKGRGGRRPYSRSHPLYEQANVLQNGGEASSANDSGFWTPALSVRGLREHLHELGLDIAYDLYGDGRGNAEKRPPRTRRQRPQPNINLTSYDGRHEWTRSAIRGGSDPITVTKAGGWKGHSPMVLRYFGELDIINENITLER